MKRKLDAHFPYLVLRALQLPATPDSAGDSGPPSAQLVMRLRQATWLPVLKARQFLLEQPRELWERILQAAETCGEMPSGGFHDPLEKDPHAGPIITQILKESTTQAEREYQDRLAKAIRHTPAGQEPYCSRLGTCHRIWGITKKRLQLEHGIEWFTPAEMNPGSCFD